MKVDIENEQVTKLIDSLRLLVEAIGADALLLLIYFMFFVMAYMFFKMLLSYWRENKFEALVKECNKQIGACEAALLQTNEFLKKGM